ncbi:MAG: hypothetical protein HOD92_14010 [Deltaproteobacteria bacterium]|jgi:hypothetical protein|nr:hypothetical protein [Deltaproteobacteria bacterium]MBT4526373.1 hypothetical protein [Deltaproteobacteria bacterium]
MCKPHYHWKNQEEESRENYYKVQASISDTETGLLKNFYAFINTIKNEDLILDSF